ncbi:MAG: prepilin-type N-terminal cleavage/methylation domain-containing protein, partial [SAR324 cluster bacterium]|nr:prepilin-type N-terminal cleavage/methylation domain-containing protein [SAR324 cluster bacterium]
QWKKRWAGFSLVEIVIAIAVIGIMSAASVPLIKSTLDKSKNSRAKSELEEVRNAAVSFYGDTFQLPGAKACSGTGVPGYMNTDKAAVTAGTATASGTLDDLDDHFNTNCNGKAAGSNYTDSSLGGAWRGPYMEANRLDPWQESYILIKGAYNSTSPGIAMSTGTDLKLDTKTDGTATDLGTGDVGLLVKLQ